MTNRQNSPLWVQRNHGQPAERDSRWNSNRDAIYKHIHVERKRAWVLWKRFGNSIYTAPRVGLVVKPLDTYENVQAFIPWEAPSGHQKITATSVSTSRRLAYDPGPGPELEPVETFDMHIDRTHVMLPMRIDLPARVEGSVVHGDRYHLTIYGNQLVYLHESAPTGDPGGL